MPLAVLARDRGVSQLRACIRPGHVASEAVARRLGMELTDELDDGERIWCGAVPEGVTG